MRQTFRLAFPLLLLAVVLAGCNDGVDSVIPSADSSSSQFVDLVVSPASAELSVVAPGNTVALTAEAVMATGAQFVPHGAVVTYSSSAPATASVSGTGLVTGVAGGNAVITVEMTASGVTRSSTVTIVVLGLGSWPALGGVYDLDSTVTDFDPAWGDITGMHQLAVLTIQHTGDTSQFTGTFSDFRAVASDGTIGYGNPGSVTGRVQTDGQLVVELTFAGSGGSYWSGRGIVTGQGIAGDYGAGGHIGGTFVATRR